MSIIKDLKIENDDYTIINSPNEDWLMNLSRINIFVGANNTGKSRFMRSLFYVDKDYSLKERFSWMSQALISSRAVEALNRSQSF